MGEINFFVERLPHLLGVYQMGQPRQAATVPVNGTHNMLHIRYGPEVPGPFRLRVEYTGQLVVVSQTVHCEFESFDSKQVLF